MKKLVFVLLMAVTFTACEGPAGPPGLDGGEWEEDAFTVGTDRWEAMNEPGTRNFYYRHRRDWSAMNEFAVERGIVVGYVEDYTAGGYTTLPHVFHDKEDDYEWTETTSLSFYDGGFEIQVTNSDFMDIRPGDKTFRIIIFK